MGCGRMMLLCRRGSGAGRSLRIEGECMRRLILCLIASPLITAACDSTNSRLPKCPGSYNAATWTNCVGTNTFPDGSQYVGEWKDDKRNGQGTFTFPNGGKYVGEFRDNKPNGQGTEYRLDGSVLQSGIWENGKIVRSQ